MPDARRLDETMSARRLDLRMNWREAAATAGISYAALRAIRKGEYQPTALTARGLDHAFQWRPGSVEAVLRGGEPTPLGDGGAPHPLAGPEVVDQNSSPHPEASAEAMRERVIAEALRGLTAEEVEQVWRNVQRHFRYHPPSGRDGERDTG